MKKGTDNLPMTPEELAALQMLYEGLEWIEKCWGHGEGCKKEGCAICAYVARGLDLYWNRRFGSNGEYRPIKGGGECCKRRHDPEEPSSLQTRDGVPACTWCGGPMHMTSVCPRSPAL